ncbi:hypothetical protein TWF281_004581 [Arthrobotrys megalospora]
MSYQTGLSKAYTKNEKSSPRKKPQKKLFDMRKQTEITTGHTNLLDDLFCGAFQDDGNHITTKIELQKYAHVLEQRGDRECNLLHALVRKLPVAVQSEAGVREADRDHDDQDRPDSEVEDGAATEVEMDPIKRALGLAEYLLVRNPALICEHDDAHSTPIELFAKQYPSILFELIDVLPSETDLQIISRRCDTTPVTRETGASTCPLERVNVCLRDFCLEPNFKRSAALENSCLHSKINTTKLQKRVTQIKDAIKDFLVLSDQRPSNKPETLLHLILGKESFDVAVTHDDQVQAQLKSFKALLQLFPKTETSVFNRPNTKGYNPLQTAILHFKESSLNYELLYKKIKALIKAQPDSIYFQARLYHKEASGKTAYVLLKDMGHIGGQAGTFKKKTEDLLKKICIRDTNPRDPNGEEIDKIKYLYSGIKCQRKIHFDLRHETSTIIDKEYVSLLRDKAALQFENILECVKLPFRVPPTVRESEDPAQQQARMDKYDAADPYISVFDWLRNHAKVEKIIAVEVDDLGENPLESTLVPHSNFAIRTCLNEDFDLQEIDKGTVGQKVHEKRGKGLGIEIWDWRKFDICSDTIQQAAPGVRLLHLYSSANIAVLKGWACEDGLRALKKLQAIRVTIYPKNQRDEVDCRNYIPVFEEKLRQGNKALIVNTIVKDSPREKIADESPMMNQSDSQQRVMHEAETQEDWIQSIANFKSCVKETIDAISAESKEPTPVVKVAILDDGVDIEHDDVNGIETGESFNLEHQPYFGGRCRHGTYMVSAFRDVCPMAKLYIGRLDDARKFDNQRFTVKSAIEALEWATQWEVDIISMSWSFKPNSNCCTEDEKKKFKNAIDKAVAQGIILFGAMPDKGPMEEINEHYPTGLTNIIRIGAAAKSGDRLLNRTNESELLFPGDGTEGSELDGYHKVTGSSVANALAAGFAALTLLCINLQAAGALDKTQHMVNMRLTQTQTELFTRLERLKTSDGMKAVFRKVSRKYLNSGDSLVQPHTALPGSIAAGQKGRQEAIKSFLNYISYS